MPPYNSINGKWISECYKKINAGELDKLKYQVTSEVILPWRRAYQMTYLYGELKPFTELVKVIDAATLAYYEDNWFCACITLLPVVEGVIDRWLELEDADYKNKCGLKNKAQKLFDAAQKKLNPEIYWHQHLLKQCEYLLKILTEVFFEDGGRYSANNQDAFNRNVMLHLLSVPDAFTNNLHTLRIFLLLDVLAVLYAATHPEESRGISPTSDASHKPELMELYFSIYKSCATRTMSTGSYHITLNKRIYEPYGI